MHIDWEGIQFHLLTAERRLLHYWPVLATLQALHVHTVALKAQYYGRLLKTCSRNTPAFLWGVRVTKSEDYLMTRAYTVTFTDTGEQSFFTLH